MSIRPPIRNLTRAHGLTLAELLLGLAFGALVLAPLAPMLQSAGAAAQVAGDRTALEREADFALERIADRIRNTAAAPGLTDKPSKDWFKPAVFSTANGMLIEQQGAEIYVLAESVSDFDLSASNPESGQPLVKVSLSLARENGASTTAVTTVRMGSALGSAP